MTPRLFVCVTCDRYAARAAGEATPGQVLAAAVRREAAGAAVAVRTVECLNGCPHPCTAALRDPGKAVIRFSGLVPADAAALVEAATTYAASADGTVTEALPAALRAKIARGVRIAA